MKTPLLFLPIVILFLSNIFGQERLHSHKDVSQKINQQQKIIQDISTNENKILTKDETDVILKDKQLEMVGGIIKNDFMINDDTIGYSDQRFPTISVNASGDFVVAWSDYRNDKWDIYFQRYNKFGVKQGLNTQVYSSAGNSDKLYPTVSMDMFGNFIIAWQENKNGNWDIYFCGFDNNGAPRGIIMKVND
ncbi:MAG TPA: hypothetical protein PK073_08350, partial [Ignavibacteriaceae bacterium]|nr:hypothetical protein [Ignavibacteriaceae bacterium]